MLLFPKTHIYQWPNISTNIKYISPVLVSLNYAFPTITYDQVHICQTPNQLRKRSAQRNWDELRLRYMHRRAPQYVYITNMAGPDKLLVLIHLPTMFSDLCTWISTLPLKIVKYYKEKVIAIRLRKSKLCGVWFNDFLIEWFIDWNWMGWWVSLYDMLG